MNCAFGPMTLRALCNSLQASQSLMARLITIQASTMLAERAGAVLKLCAGNIDFERRTITVPKEIQKGPGLAGRAMQGVLGAVALS